MKRGVLFILLVFLLGMTAVSVVDAGKTYLTPEDLGRNALAKKEAEGWEVYTIEINLENDWAKLPATYSRRDDIAHRQKLLRYGDGKPGAGWCMSRGDSLSRDLQS
jgi:hypothetical protein